MTAYRFCRTDDIGLLVGALNRCWAPYVPDEPAVDAVAFKRSIRDLQVWCSSCMVAFAGPDPIGVLIGAKRPSGTLVHRIAVHPDHRRQGHGRHLLESLSAKLAILGPSRLVAEVPDHLDPACALFKACGFVQDAVLTDYVRPDDAVDAEAVGTTAAGGDGSGTFVIPVTADDLVANGLLDEADETGCWGRALESLRAQAADVAGLAVASDERLEACLLYVPQEVHAEILAMHAATDAGGDGLRRLLTAVRAQGLRSFRFPKVHPSEWSAESLAALGFRPAERHRRFAGHAAQLAAQAAS